jgi:putative spermidine/putrescine transport system ATP-binding protein/spermidine/putrescine transport system ATP-binding protein
MSAGEADVRLDKVRKTFGAVVAVNDITLDIARGSIFSLLGPSGCGKTTTLRLIAGFEQPNAGEVYIRGKRVTAIAPYRRDFSMVFQSYALFPHLNVAENVAFGLRMRRVPRGERGTAIAEALELKSSAPPSAISSSVDSSAWRWHAMVVSRRCCSTSRWARWTRCCARRCWSNCASWQRLDITAVFVTHDQEEA